MDSTLVLMKHNLQAKTVSKEVQGSYSKNTLFPIRILNSANEWNIQKKRIAA